MCVLESGELWAEEINQGREIMPEVDPSSETIGLEDIQIPDPDGNTTEEADRRKNHREETKYVEGERKRLTASRPGGYM